MWSHTPTDATLVLDDRPLAFEVYRADSTLSQAVGVIGRRGVPDGVALVFPVGRVRTCRVHMVGVRAPIRAWWVRDGTLVETAQLTAWTGYEVGRADCLVELPADAPEGTVGQPVALDTDEPP